MRWSYYDKLNVEKTNRYKKYNEFQDTVLDRMLDENYRPFDLTYLGEEAIMLFGVLKMYNALGYDIIDVKILKSLLHRYLEAKGINEQLDKTKIIANLPPVTQVDEFIENLEYIFNSVDIEVLFDLERIFNYTGRNTGIFIEFKEHIILIFVAIDGKIIKSDYRYRGASYLQILYKYQVEKLALGKIDWHNESNIKYPPLSEILSNITIQLDESTSDETLTVFVNNQPTEINYSEIENVVNDYISRIFQLINHYASDNIELMKKLQDEGYKGKIPILIVGITNYINGFADQCNSKITELWDKNVKESKSKRNSAKNNPNESYNDGFEVVNFAAMDEIDNWNVSRRQYIENLLVGAD